MTYEQQTVLLMKGALAELPEPDQLAVKAAVEKIRAVIAENPQAGAFAVALIGAEMQATA